MRNRVRHTLMLAAFVLLANAAAVLFAAGASAAPAGNATITFQKVFKSSYAEFVEIKINDTGAGTYDIRQLDDDPNPQPVQVSAATAKKIFDLSAKLHNFQGVDLEVHKRLASLGEKTFRYESNGVSHETKFNYTTDATAGDLLNLFENLARQETDLADLKRTMRYDRLGVNDVMMRIEEDYDGKLLPEPEQFLTSLDQLGADEKYVNIARDRARKLAERIRLAQ